VLSLSAAFEGSHGRGMEEYCRNLTLTVALKSGATLELHGRATFFKELSLCVSVVWGVDDTGHPARPHTSTHRESGVLAYLAPGGNPPPPPPMGNCTLYTNVTSVGPAATPGTVSGGSAISNSTVELFPSWPASSPWVTAVGATRFLNHTIGQPEMASDQFGSGGGFSALFNQSHAGWQAAAVAKYVASGPSLPKWPPSGSFPPSGRATPDLSLLGEGYQVYVSGQVEPVGGTSASSPAFAGYVSLINEARAKAGKPQLGFLNPFLYANPDAFYDVIEGTNAIGRGTGALPFGFAAAPGWDAATGLGTPRFDKLLAAALKA